jgi:signal peptidase I
LTTSLATETRNQQAAPAAEAAPRRNAVSEWTVTVLLVLFLIMLLGQAFVIPTVSMEDTLLPGDHVIVDKLAYGPPGMFSKHVLPYNAVRRGDIIVFRWPIDLRKTYVKRVIGLPGDRIRIANKQVYLNGRALEEPYTQHKTPYFDSYRDNFPSEPNVPLHSPAQRMLEQCVANGEVVVPPGMYFALGDNRDVSEDSRYWGFVPRANIIGTPVLIWWSYDAPAERLADANPVSPAGLLDLAKNFFRKTRWSRSFRLVRGYPVR